MPDVLKVAIDARALLPPVTGIGTYTRGISGALAQRSGLDVRLFSPRPLPPDGGGTVAVASDRHPLGMIWVQTVLSRRARDWGADVLLAALTIGPVRGSLPFVSVVHDLTAWSHPEWHRSRTLVGFVPLWEWTAERAARFVCVSRETARELMEAFPETASRVRVIPNGVDDEFTPAPEGADLGETRQRFAGGRRYVLYLGALEPRKNVQALVAACEILWSGLPGAPDLVLAGGDSWKTGPLQERIASSRFRDRIHLTGYATRETARDLYRAAEVFVYPSVAEGFGLPVLEAMACGTPVVASTAPALREVAGDAALFAEPRDTGAIAHQIERVLEDPRLASRMTAEGRARAARFSWKAAAEATSAVLAEAAGRTGA